MRSKFLAYAALVVVGLSGSFAPVAKADPKSKSAPKKKQSELDDKAINKQLQWEDKVMGPDDKRAELDKIARAQAVNKAASEKAEKEKAEKEKQAAKEAEKPKPQVKRNEVALPSVPDDPPKPERAEAPPPPPPPPVKTGDDKFIDKLLKEDGPSKRRSASK